jgi:hypothetical protein
MVIAARLRCRFAGVAVHVLLLLVPLLAVCAPAPVQAQDVVKASEPRVKAAFLFKFGDYVEWPAGTFGTPTTPLSIGVMDADALAGELSAVVAGHLVGGRPVEVRRLRHGDSTAGLQVIFVGEVPGTKLADLLAPLQGQAALVVTDSADGIAPGCVINFVVVSDKLRFDVSLPSAQARGLKVSSRLLAVARKVIAAP